MDLICLFFSVYFMCNVFRCFRVILVPHVCMLTVSSAFPGDGIVIFKIIIFTIQTTRVDQ